MKQVRFGLEIVLVEPAAKRSVGGGEFTKFLGLRGLGEGAGRDGGFFEVGERGEQRSGKSLRVPHGREVAVARNHVACDLLCEQFQSQWRSDGAGLRQQIRKCFEMNVDM